MQQTKIAFVGAGNMASAIIGGLINNGYDAQNIWAADPFPASLEKIAANTGINTHSDNNAIINKADVVILAIKPQQMQTVCTSIQQSLVEKNPLIISIAAGITCNMLESWTSKKLAIVRCMPNTPALVKTAATGLYANTHVTAEQRNIANQLLQAIGIVSWVDNEALLDAVTAVSGSGPAYFFLVMEAMQAAGKELGLSAEAAQSLTLQTALGAAKMAIESDVDVGELRRRVTSPNGTTEAAINSFEDDNFKAIFLKALTAADQRSKSLAKEMQ